MRLCRIPPQISLRDRLYRHIRSGRLTPGSKVYVLALRDITRDGLRYAEQLAIEDCGGVTALANKWNVVNRDTRDWLKKLHGSLDGLLRTL